MPSIFFKGMSQFQPPLGINNPDFIPDLVKSPQNFIRKRQSNAQKSMSHLMSSGGTQVGPENFGPDLIINYININSYGLFSLNAENIKWDKQKNEKSTVSRLIC